MKCLGVDYGTKKIGIAVSDDTGAVAFPLTTIHSDRNAVSEVAALAQSRHVAMIVIGESRDLNGERNPVMENIEQFKKDLEDLTGLPIAYESELFTSAQAARQFAPDGSRKENPSQEKLDAAAAALILQGYLDKNKR
jgi:putative Holliday junction resolvase